MIFAAYSDRFVLDLPEGHRFPMIKYELVKEQLIREGVIDAEHIIDPGLIDPEIILETHDSVYWSDLINLKLSPRAFRKIGFPPSQRLIRRSQSSSMGTLFASQKALEHGIGMNIAGGTHHAYSDRGEAFCLLNDIAISANYLLNRKLANKVLVIDLDVHQGNGTAEIFAYNKQVFTFSVHGEANYPLHKETSDLDISLPPQTNNKDYLHILNITLPDLIRTEKPDFIFYQAGVDVLKTDKLGTLALSKEACKTRDEIVLTLCKKHEIPVVVTMGGGYSPKVADIVDAHVNTFKVATETFL